MRWHWAIPAGAALTPQERLRTAFILGCSVIGSLWAWVVAVGLFELSDALGAAAVAGGVLLALAIPLARSGRLSAAAWVVTVAVVVTTAVVLISLGPQSRRLGSALAVPLLVGAAVGPRAALLAGGLLAAVLVGMGWIGADGGQPLASAVAEAPWLPVLRDLVGVTAVVVVLRLGYDWVRAELAAYEAEQRASAQLIEEQAGILEDRVHERNALLERRLRARDDLATAMADRLRLPLEKISIALGKLSKETAAERDIERATSAAQRMSLMTERLLEHARLGTSLTKVELDLDAIVAEIVEELGATAVDWKLGSLPPIYGDVTLVRIALENLLGNAVKFSRTREAPVIEVCWVPEQAALVVRDNGVGFDLRFANKLFKPFQRLHGTADFEGVGVGLANVRRIAVAHGGRCWAAAEVDKGASFYIALPGLEGPD